MLKFLVFVLMAHMMGDYFLQTDYLAINKGKDNYILLAHSVLYSVGVMIIAKLMGLETTIIQLLLLSAIHFPVDYIKARGITVKWLGDKKALVLDQMVHYLTLIFVMILN